MGTLSLARIIQDFELDLKALESVYCANGAAIEGLADRNSHKQKVLDEEKMSSGKVHGTKVRGASANSPKICSCTVIC